MVRKKVEDQLKKLEKKTAVERALQMKKSNSENKSNLPKDEDKVEISHQGFALSAFITLNKSNEYPLSPRMMTLRRAFRRGAAMIPFDDVVLGKSGSSQSKLS